MRDESPLGILLPRTPCARPRTAVCPSLQVEGKLSRQPRGIVGVGRIRHLEFGQQSVDEVEKQQTPPLATTEKGHVM